MRKAIAVGATAVAAGLALAVPAWAAPVTSPHVITVFPDRDMVVTEEYEQAGTPMQVKVLRNGVQIGGTSPDGETVAGAAGFGLEVNHGPLGAAAPGDCWEGVTPDIMGGDVVQVITNPGAGNEAVEETLVADVAITAGPEEVTSDNLADFPNNRAGDIVLQGRAVAQGGGQFPLAELSEEVRDLATRFRGAPDTLAYDSPTATTWTATYRPGFLDNQVKPGSVVDEAGRKDSILKGGHSMVWSNGAANEVTISEQGEPGGPAPGCEAAPASRNALVSASPDVVNIANGGGSATASGVVQDGIDVSVSLNGVPFDATSITVDRAGATWTTSFPASALQEGNNTVSASFSGPGAPTQPQTKTIVKDTTAPVVTANPGTDTNHVGSVSVALTSDGGEQVRYTTDGSNPTPSNSKAYDGTRFNLGIGTHTVKAFAVDDAKNRTDASFTYTVVAPPPPPNAAPVARPDSYRVNEDATLRGASVLKNDLDANGDPLTAKLVKAAKKGKLTLRANGTFTYKPRPNFFGTDSFTYQAVDNKGALSAPVKVNLKVIARPN